ncbi:hypothetical protein E4U54_006675, partial [Claviceps lovelessii]
MTYFLHALPNEPARPQSSRLVSSRQSVDATAREDPRMRHTSTPAPVGDAQRITNTNLPPDHFLTGNTHNP